MSSLFKLLYTRHLQSGCFGYPFLISVYRKGVNETDQGQIARIFGARAESPADPRKCDYVRDGLGFDAAINHRSGNFTTELAAACPNGIDVHFEKVGGHVWSAVFPLLNDFARIPVCGPIAHYNEDRSVADTQDQLPAVMRAILRKSLNILVSPLYPPADTPKIRFNSGTI